MKTSHQIIFNNSNHMNTIPSESISLAVTSPPYPMIKMWDEMFISQNPALPAILLADEIILAVDNPSRGAYPRINFHRFRQVYNIAVRPSRNRD
jgi:DNA modification methylase